MLRAFICVISLTTLLSFQSAMADSGKAIESAAGLAAAVAAAATLYNVNQGKEDSAKCPAVTISCVSAAAAYAQVPISVASMVSALNTKKQSSAQTADGLGDFSATGGLNDSAPTGIQQQADGFLKEAEDGLAALEDKGFTVNDDGSITGPDGSTASASSLGSGQALADSGLIPKSQIEAYDNKLKEIKKKKDKIIVKSQGGGSRGGYSGPRKSRRSASTDYNPYASGLDPSKIRAAQTGGLTKDFVAPPLV